MHVGITADSLIFGHHRTMVPDAQRRHRHCLVEPLVDRAIKDDCWGTSVAG
jgi:hypothetical protein